MISADIYLRISEDKELTGEGVKNQEGEARKLADRLGWSVRGVYVDNDVSAYSMKSRPDWERMLADIEADPSDRAIIGWHVDRLPPWRGRDMESFIDFIERHGTEVRTVTAGLVDLSTPSGRQMARIGAAIARGESEHKGERIRLKHRQLFTEGRRVGGGLRPFGLTADYSTIVPEEAELIREAAHRVIAGEGLYAIARDFERRGVVGPERPKRLPGGERVKLPGTPIGASSLKSILLKPRLIGAREYQGTDKKLRGQLSDVRGFPAILDDETFNRVRAILTRPERAVARRYQPARKYFLTGVVRCGLCDTKLISRRTGVRNKHSRRYTCPKVPGLLGCGKVAVLADAVEDLVGRAIVDYAKRGGLPDAVEAELDDSPTIAKITELEAYVDELAAMLGRRELTPKDFMIAKAATLEEIEELRTEVQENVRDRGRERALGLAAQWDEIPFEERSPVARAIFNRVLVDPVKRRGGSRFDPDRIRLDWRT